MKKKTKPKAKINDVFLHKETKLPFIVRTVMDQPKGKLFTFKELGTGDEITYKRCYENEISKKYEKVKNAKAAKILYGRKK